MQHADAPSGPGKPVTARRDAATEAEELDELGGESTGGATPPSTDATRDAQSAERRAHGSGTDKSSVGNPGLAHPKG